LWNLSKLKEFREQTIKKYEEVFFMTNSTWKRISSAGLSAVILAGLLAGCNSGTSSSSSSSAPSPSGSSSSAAGSPSSASGEAPSQAVPTLPLSEPLTITVFSNFNAKFVGKVENYNDIPFIKWWSEQTGATIDFQTIANEVWGEQFGLKIASKDLPDVFNGVGPYSGGDLQALKDGVIVPLTPYMEQGYMPNLSKFYETFPKYADMARTSDGDYLSIPMIRGYSENLNSNGLVVRKDLLDQAGLEVPTTIEEWDTALRAFKTMNVIPFSPRDNKWLNTNMPFISAWNMTYFEYQDNGVVKYGAIQPEFKEYLQLMHTWYEDGLLDPDYLTSDTKTITAKVSAGLVGSYVGAAGGNLQNPWYALVEENVDSPIEYIGAPVPTLEKGATPKIGPRYDEMTANTGFYMSSKCANPELTALVLDYIYSEEANRAFYFGVEGTNYNLTADGLIDPYEKQADGTYKNLGDSWKPGFADAGSGALIGIMDYANKTILDPTGSKVVVPMPLGDNPDAITLKKRHIDEVRQEALSLWASFEAVNRVPAQNFTVEDAQARADIYGDIETYVYEGVTQFIMGQRDLDTFDAFVSEIQAMGVDKALAITQKYLDAQKG